MAGKRTEIGLDITATDDASKVIDQVADSLEQLEDGAEVEVDADVGDAERAIDRFAREIEDLTDSGKELRIDFREQVLQQKIRKLLRDLEKLDDPQEIRVKSTELENAERDLRDLREFAGKDIEVDVNVDTAKSGGIRQARDDVRGLSETAQSGIGPLRGFTDELGGAAGQGGTMANAIIDAGEAVEIFGARAGLSADAIGKISGALAGVGLAIGAGVAAWSAWSSSVKDAREQAEQSVDDLVNQAAALEGVNEQLDLLQSSDPYIAQIFAGDDNEDKINGIADALGNVKLEFSDLPDAAARATNDVAAFSEERLRALNVPADIAAEYARARTELGKPLFPTTDPNFAAYSSEINIVQDSVDALLTSTDNFQDASVRLAVLTDNTARLNTMLDNGRSWPEIFQALSRDLGGAGEITEGNTERMDDLRRSTEEAGEAGIEAGEDIDYGMSAAQRAIKRTQTEIDILRDRFNVDAVAKRFKERMIDALDGTVESAREAQLAALDYLETLGNVPPQLNTKIVAAIDQNRLGEAERLMNDFVNRRRIISVGVRLAGGVTGGSDKIGGITISEAPGGQPIPQQTVNNYYSQATARQIAADQTRWNRINGAT